MTYYLPKLKISNGNGTEVTRNTGKEVNLFLTSFAYGFLRGIEAKLVGNKLNYLQLCFLLPTPPSCLNIYT